MAEIFKVILCENFFGGFIIFGAKQIKHNSLFIILLILEDFYRHLQQKGNGLYVASRSHGLGYQEC